MLYLERKPSPSLAPFVRSLWLARDLTIQPSDARQRVLPSGCIQIVLNLAADTLTDARGALAQPQAPALVTGVHRGFLTIATQDFRDLAGVVIEPGGFKPLFAVDADHFSDNETALEAVMPRTSETLRTRMRETPCPTTRLDLLEDYLQLALLAQPVTRAAPCRLTAFVRDELTTGTRLSEIVRRSGRSPRHLTETFRRQVGVTPKVFDRIQRFQRALTALHRGQRISWAQLALDCGFYDQAHFAHEFRAFSGISPTQYAVSPRMWQNHVTLDPAGHQAPC